MRHKTRIHWKIVSFWNGPFRIRTIMKKDVNANGQPLVRFDRLSSVYVFLSKYERVDCKRGDKWTKKSFYFEEKVDAHETEKLKTEWNAIRKREKRHVRFRPVKVKWMRRYIAALMISCVCVGKWMNAWNVNSECKWNRIYSMPLACCYAYSLEKKSKRLTAIPTNTIILLTIYVYDMCGCAPVFYNFHFTFHIDVGALVDNNINKKCKNFYTHTMDARAREN